MKTFLLFAAGAGLYGGARSVARVKLPSVPIGFADSTIAPDELDLVGTWVNAAIYGTAFVIIAKLIK